MPIHAPSILNVVRDLRFSNPHSFCDVSLSQYAIESRIKLEGKPLCGKHSICGHLSTNNVRRDVREAIKLGEFVKILAIGKDEGT